jgi:hypothetical protein
MKHILNFWFVNYNNIYVWIDIMNPFLQIRLKKLRKKEQRDFIKKIK